MTVIDVHTHMLDEQWLAMLEQHGDGYSLGEVPGGQQAIHVAGAPFMTLTPGMFDYSLRIQAMDEAGVDMAVVSLTSPNVFWGGPEVSQRVARITNDGMAVAERMYPTRIRWLASLPWQYPDRALDELARAHRAGAVGVMVLANIGGESLANERFVPIWREIDRRSLPVLVHPTSPPGVEHMDMSRYNLVAAVGFAFDTTLAIARLVFAGFLDRFPNVKLIAAHGGGALPYLAGRMDQWHRSFAGSRERIASPPSEYLGRVYYDAVLYDQAVLELCVRLGGADHVLYGSDYPHNVGDMAGCLSRVDALEPTVAKLVRGKNAARIFGL